MRPLIPYDLDGPPTAPSGPSAPPHWNTRRPPMKKRKRNHRNPPLQHWDDPGNVTFGVVYGGEEGSPTAVAPLADEPVTMTYVDDLQQEEEYGEEAVEEDEAVDVEEEEGRPLTHEEIWDDAALVDAWNSAEAEYEAYHGGSKAWKTEPVKKSPLWYNNPYTPKPSSSKPKAPLKHTTPQEQEQGELEPDTAPLDFHTYVPTHDPSLAVPSGANPTTTAPFFVPPPSTTMVSRDEAFNNALGAMYWGGYWTAVYHCQSQSSEKHNDAAAEATEDDIEADKDEDEDKEDLVPAQR
ncbi:hypothetical protein J3R83DRAFT_7051 [Lanmaoa asiatica]|nr:hypothetical protein J3R83DRAFT_7051 [Lanmaoa asiatica]